MEIGTRCPRGGYWGRARTRSWLKGSDRSLETYLGSNTGHTSGNLSISLESLVKPHLPAQTRKDQHRRPSSTYRWKLLEGFVTQIRPRVLSDLERINPKRAGWVRFSAKCSFRSLSLARNGTGRPHRPLPTGNVLKEGSGGTGPGPRMGRGTLGCLRVSRRHRSEREGIPGSDRPCWGGRTR